MRNVILLGVCLVAIFLVSGCTQSSGMGDNDTNEQNIRETVFTESLVFDDPDMKGSITKNKVTKTFSSDLDIYIEDEKNEMFGSMVPITVNSMCNMWAIVMFNETALENLQESGTMSGESEPVFWEGYIATRSHIDFINNQTKQKLAECTATSLDDITYIGYGEYVGEDFSHGLFS